MTIIPFTPVKGPMATLAETISLFKEITPRLDQHVNLVKQIATSREVSCSEYYLISMLESFKQQFGFNYMCWFEIQNQKIDFLSTYPDTWIDHYVQGSYQHQDKVVDKVSTTLHPFLWSSESSIEAFVEDKRILGLAVDCDIRSGITLPVAFREDTITALSFSSPKPLTEFQKTLESNLNELMLLSHLFNMLLKAHQVGIDSMEETHQAISFYRGNLRV